MTDTKKIKVKITDTAGTYTTDGKTYLPDDIVQIDPSDFCDWFMEKVEPKLVKAVVTTIEEPKEEATPTDETIPSALTIPPSLVEPKETKKRRRKS